MTDLLNLIVAPNSTSYIALFLDLFNFMLMPIVGGLLMTNVNLSYQDDPVTYQLAEISKNEMYSSQMKLIKTTLYKMIGKPDFFKNTKAAYHPPQDASWVGF